MGSAETRGPRPAARGIRLGETMMRTEFQIYRNFKNYSIPKLPILAISILSNLAISSFVGTLFVLVVFVRTYRRFGWALFPPENTNMNNCQSTTFRSRRRFRWAFVLSKKWRRRIDDQAMVAANWHWWIYECWPELTKLRLWRSRKQRNGSMVHPLLLTKLIFSLLR